MLYYLFKYFSDEQTFTLNFFMTIGYFWQKNWVCWVYTQILKKIEYFFWVYTQLLKKIEYFFWVYTQYTQFFWVFWVECRPIHSIFLSILSWVSPNTLNFFEYFDSGVAQYTQFFWFKEFWLTILTVTLKILCFYNFKNIFLGYMANFFILIIYNFYINVPL